MALKIRLRQQGRRNQLTYRLVLADSRLPRDGKYLEKLGYYDPHIEGSNDATIFEDRIQYWIERGAELTEKAQAIIFRKAPEVMKFIQNKEEAKKKLRSEKRKKNKKK